MHAPWITKFYYRDFDTFIVPLGNGNITLGTSKDYENYDLSINKRDSESIIERCASVVPSIRRAKIIKEWVGLRPHRHILRIEIEKRQDLIVSSIAINEKLSKLLGHNSAVYKISSNEMFNKIL